MRTQDSGWRNGPAPAGGEATGAGLSVTPGLIVGPGLGYEVSVTPGLIVGPGLGDEVSVTPGLNVGTDTRLDVTAGLNDAGNGLSDGGFTLDEPVQATSGTPASMLPTITNRPRIRTVRV
jgi:hypothetical protein